MKILGNFLSLVPLTNNKEDGPFFTFEYKNNLNHTELTLENKIWKERKNSISFKRFHRKEESCLYKSSFYKRI